MNTRKTAGAVLVSLAGLFSLAILLGGGYSLLFRKSPGSYMELTPEDVARWRGYDYWTDSVWPVFGVLCGIAAVAALGYFLIEKGDENGD